MSTQPLQHQQAQGEPEPSAGGLEQVPMPPASARKRDGVRIESVEAEEGSLPNHWRKEQLKQSRVEKKMERADVERVSRHPPQKLEE